MKPGFALSLSFEGISLLQRAAGGWRSVGEVPLDTSDLASGLAALKDKALALNSGEMRCKVIIPNDQVRYLSVETGSFNGDARAGMVRTALDGATPYPVDDLAYDTSVDGNTTHVAAVARETLAEAESFAVEHGFHPLCFVAAPGDQSFLGEPFFGVSSHATTLTDVYVVEPDGVAVVVIGPVETPMETAEPESKQEEPEVTETEPASAGFSSRRGRAKKNVADGTATPEQDTTPPSPSLGGAKRVTLPPPPRHAGASCL